MNGVVDFFNKFIVTMINNKTINKLYEISILLIFISFPFIYYFLSLPRGITVLAIWALWLGLYLLITIPIMRTINMRHRKRKMMRYKRLQANTHIWTQRQRKR
ncbi:MAG: hypothetical protein CMN98_04030 [Synechococcus sp. NP17]|nr:hypothetical protein [Synechococcus sp. NP17]